MGTNCAAICLACFCLHNEAEFSDGSSRIPLAEEMYKQESSCTNARLVQVLWQFYTRHNELVVSAMIDLDFM